MLMLPCIAENSRVFPVSVRRAPPMGAARDLLCQPILAFGLSQESASIFDVLDVEIDFLVGRHVVAPGLVFLPAIGYLSKFVAKSEVFKRLRHQS